ncbi:MFS transporter, partial [Chloroflexota bacterium]
MPVMALYAYELGAGVSVVGLIIGLYSITNTPANIIFGRLIDRVGSKFPLIIGLIGDALGMFLYSLCRLPVHLALVRALHGISGGVVGPATMSIISGQSGGPRRARVMGIYGIALAAATLVGYGLSGLLVSRLGYQALFLFATLLLLIGAAISLLLPGGRQKKTAAETAPGAAPIRMTELLKRRGIVVAYCSIFAQYFTFGGVVTLLPLYVKGLGMEAFHVGMLLAMFAVMFIIVQIPGGTLSDRVGRKLPVAIGLVLGAISLFALPSLTTF